jgi:signal transduction histidine kinase
MAATANKEQENELQMLRAEVAAQVGLCRTGLAADVVLHEFSNVLNAIMLQTAVVQQKAAEPLRSDLNSIRDQGRIAANLMRQLQLYSRQRQPAPHPVDLNRIARAAAVAPPGGPAVVLDLAPTLPPVSASFAELKLLAILLVSSAVAVTPTGGVVRIRTSHDAGTVRLHVEDGGLPLGPEALTHVFDPWTSSREGVDPLDMGVCQMLARRLQAGIHAESRADGVTLVVALRIP